jgi:restriction system protein
LSEIPDYQSLMLPLLRLCANGSITLRAAVQALGDQFGLTPEQVVQKLPSGQAVIYNRTGWAKTELLKAGLIQQPQRGLFEITDRGRALLAEKPERINRPFLMRYPEFKAYIEASQQRSIATGDDEGETAIAATIPIEATTQTPTERIDAAVAEIEAELRDELLDRIFAIENQTQRAAFFEDLVVKLLVGMGYGKNIKDAGKRIGQTGDGGVDGVINLDPLGIDRVYVQAKCYGREKSVSEGEVRDFSGSLDVKKTNRGVFTTTAGFSGPAKAYVANIQKPIVLINGGELTRLMIAHNIGVREERQVAIKKLDADFFEG